MTTDDVLDLWMTGPADADDPDRIERELLIKSSSRGRVNSDLEKRQAVWETIEQAFVGGFYHRVDIPALKDKVHTGSLTVKDIDEIIGPSHLSDRLHDRPSYLHAIKKALFTPTAKREYEYEATDPVLDRPEVAVDFAVSSLLGESAPGVRLAGAMHAIRFPLLPGDPDLPSLVAAAHKAPFGRGRDTVVDTAVRDTWEIAPAGFTITNRAFDAAVVAAVRHVANAFGLPTNEVAHVPHKLLVYEPGSHFAPHVDSEKQPGMFATLVVELPSVYTGGELVVSHAGVSKTFCYGDGLHARYVAFFADCVHEFRPLASGYRVVLTYNLVLRDVPAESVEADDGHHTSATVVLPTAAARFDAAVTSRSDPKELRRGFMEWCNDTSADAPDKLAMLLAHKYTAQSLELCTNVLKGQDRMMFAQLLDAKPDTIDVYLAFVRLDVELGYDGDGGEDDYKMGNVERFLYPGNLQATKITLASVKPICGALAWPEDPAGLVLGVTRREILGVTRFVAIQPSVQCSGAEYTGNEAMHGSAEYNHLAIVLRRRPAVADALKSNSAEADTSAAASANTTRKSRKRKSRG